jgi:uncharacterized protein (TIGR02246 family)
MKTRVIGFLGVIGLLIGLAAGLGPAQQSKADATDKDALAKAAEAFVEAFHKGDAKAVAAFWTVDGDYTDQSGKHLKGREAIEKAFAVMFTENKDAKLRIDSEALEMVSPDVAVEDGVSAVFPADGGPPSRARYTIVHVKKDGKWSLSNVRESAYVPPSNAKHLEGLGWLTGEWAGEIDKGHFARLSFAWTESDNFIVSHFAATFKDEILGGGTSWIGWDPAAKCVRSWSFENNGSFGEGAWTSEGEGHAWTIKMTSTLPDGKKATVTNIISRIDADTISLASKTRTVDGKEMPDLKEVKLKRQK